MPEPISTPASSPAVSPDLSKIEETISSLNDQLTSISERLDSFEAAKTPEPEPKPEWTPKSWDEFPKMAEEVARKVVEETVEASKLQQEEAKKQEVDAQKAIDKSFDDALENLEKSGRIPKVENPNDPNDAGKLARKELFGLGIKYKNPNLLVAADQRDDLRNAGLAYDVAADKFVKIPQAPAGQFAPVGSSAKTSPTSTKPTYKEIHNLSMDQLIRRFNQ